MQFYHTAWDIYRRMLIATLSVIKQEKAKLPKWPSRVDKLKNTHTMEYSIGIKMNGLEWHGLKGVNFKNIILVVNKQIIEE